METPKELSKEEIENFRDDWKKYISEVGFTWHDAEKEEDN